MDIQKLVRLTHFLPMSKFYYRIVEILILKLDVDPQRDNDVSPMSTYRCMLRPTGTWIFISVLQQSTQVKKQVKFNFELFWKKKLDFLIPIL